MYRVNISIEAYNSEEAAGIMELVIRKMGSDLPTVIDGWSMTSYKVEEEVDDDPPEGLVDPGLWYKLNRVMEIAGVEKQQRDLTHIEMANARLFVKERKDI